MRSSDRRAERLGTATRILAGVGLALASLLAGDGVAAHPGSHGDQASVAIRIDGDSFWYARIAPDADDGVRGETAPAPDAVERVVAALDELLARDPDSFPQPPPLPTVIRAVAREQARATVAWSSALGSYGCATLLDGVVVIDVAPSTFVGRDALDDAELRSFLGHELVHAYQYARGGHGHDPDEIARRENAALDWEITHLEPGVRAAYREDLRFNLAMYRAMLLE